MLTQTEPQLQYFDEMLPGENNVLSFNFAQGLASGVTLSGTPTVSVMTFAGTDTTPSAILNGGASFDSTNTIVQVPVAVTKPWNKYLISVFCATTNSELELGLRAVLPVGA